LEEVGDALLSKPLRAKSRPMTSSSRRRRCIAALSVACGLSLVSEAHAMVEDEIAKQCKSAGDWASCADAVEGALLAKYPHIARRVGDMLELDVASGKVELTNTTENAVGDEITKITYYFVDYLAEIEHFLILETYYEGRRYSLVGRKYGARSRLDDVPIFSSDRVHFVTVSICDAYCPYRLQIWKRHGGNDWFELAWSSSPYRYWTDTEAEWVDNTTIRVSTRTKERPEDRDLVPHNFYIRLGADGWERVDALRGLK
jgi:hypothetical protein